jgi:hypothetical protein
MDCVLREELWRHERERNKRLSHLNHLKGGKKQRYKAKLAEKEDNRLFKRSKVLAKLKYIFYILHACHHRLRINDAIDCLVIAGDWKL